VTGTSVIIPVRDGAATIARQLAALADQDLEGAEVVVADNGSRDETVRIAESFRGRLDLRVVDASATAGPGPARNAGAREAKGDVLLFVDADDLVLPGWYGPLAAAAAEGPAGGPVLYVDSSQLATGVPDVSGRRWPERLPRHEGIIPFHGACNLGLPRQLFHDLGGFDPRFGRAEDIDMSIRLAAAGHDIAFVPEARLLTSRRPGLRSAARQFYDYGRFEPLLRRTHPDAYRDLPATAGLRRWGKVLLTVPRLRHRPGRYSWVTGAATVAGRATGALQIRIGRLG
jgi:glycosyltransferase involved in cell wall biosynthesis